MYRGPNRTKTNIYTESQVRRALQGAGLDIASEISTHFIVFCPYHSNHRTPSGEVDKETGMFYCFSCSSTTSLVGLMGKMGINYFRAMRLIGDEDYNIVDQLDKILVDQSIPEFDVALIERLHSDVWGRGSEYLNSRFISNSMIQKYQLGYSARQDMITIPVHSPHGVLWGFVGRSVTGKAFKNNRGLPKRKTLFNVHRVWTHEEVYVVESALDAIRMTELGFPAVATLGSGISSEQIDLLQKTFDGIILVPDNDDAGRGMTEKILSQIPYTQLMLLEFDPFKESDDKLLNTLKTTKIT